MFKGDFLDFLFRLVCVFMFISLLVPYIYTEGTLFDGTTQQYYTAMYSSFFGGITMMLVVAAFVVSFSNRYIVSSLLALAATGVCIYAIHVREAEFVASLAQNQVNHGAIDLAGGFYWLTTCLMVLPGTAILYAGFKIKGRN